MTNKIVCKTCGKVFQFKSHLKRHLAYSRSCVNEPKVVCTGPSMSFRIDGPRPTYDMAYTYPVYSTAPRPVNEWTATSTFSPF